MNVLNTVLPIFLVIGLGLRRVGILQDDLVGAPTAVIGYVMTRELGGDVKLTGAIVIGSTLLSLATIAG